MENCVFKEICTQDNTLFRLYVNILSSSVEIIVLQKDNAWKSTVQKKTLQPFAEQHKFTLENYCLKLIEYVKNVDPEVAFIFDNNQITINRVLKGSLMVKYFTSKVEKVDYVKHVEQIMDHLYSEKLKSSEQLNTLKTENEELKKNKNECESKLKDLIERKLTDEDEHFGQFILILNEKKRRIQHLTELLEAFNNGRPPINPQVVPKKAKKRKSKKFAPVRKLETISDSETDSESSISGKTEDSEENPDPPESKPSTSTENFDFLDDSFAPHSLPKRIKVAKIEEDVVVASKSPPKTEEPEVIPRNKSPEIDLSTQQLLDMF